MNWFFDEVQSGRYQGINDSGIETFNDNAIRSVVRESLQNSLDAIRDENKPVKVCFNTKKIKTKDLPGYDEHLSILKLCVQESINRKDSKAIQVFSKMVEYYSQEEIGLLVISDYNTTGLTGINSTNGSFDSLIKSEGYSLKKNKSSGGSFGIGKNASYSTSALRTLFYNTLNEENEMGFQGTTILTSHKLPSSDNYRLAKGFFPIKPITTKHKYFNKILQRNEMGTDIIIVGFDYEDFDKECIDTVVNMFYMSLEKDKLEVEVNNTLINKNTYGKVISKNLREIQMKTVKRSSSVRRDCIKAEQNYRAIKKDVFIKKVNIGDIEDSIEVYLNYSDTDKLSQEIVGTRKSGMSIQSFNTFRAEFGFSGVIYVESEEINAILQSMENPNHDKWEPSRHPKGVREGRLVIKEIKRAIQEVLDSISLNVESSDTTINGIDNLFNDGEELITNKKIQLRQKVKKVDVKNDINKEKAFLVMESVYGGLTAVEKSKINLEENFKLLSNNKLRVSFYNIEDNRYSLSFKADNNSCYYLEFSFVGTDENTPLNIKNLRGNIQKENFEKFDDSSIVLKNVKPKELFSLEIMSLRKYRSVVEVKIYAVEK